MNTLQQGTITNRLLIAAAEKLDLTPTQHQQAVERYQAVGRWLCVPGTLLAVYNPEISPQGSFRIGTVIKPWNNTELYDLDFTVKLLTTHLLVSQKHIKDLLGERLREHADYRRMLDDEHHRCWRLIYAEDTSFYMDLVSAIPELPFRLQALDVPERFRLDPMAITDTRHPQYSERNAQWPKCNMKGFAEWFIERMQFQLDLAVKAYASEHRMSVEEVQVYHVKTPLQRVVQILKRHRDLMFKDDEDAPISVIITTLAALSYDQYAQGDVYSSLTNITSKMRGFVERRWDGNKYIYWIQNPVDPSDNFADKWQITDRKRKLFFQWLDRVESDFTKAFKQKGLHNIAAELKLSLGEGIVNHAVRSVTLETRGARDSGRLLVNPANGVLGAATGRPMPKHTHYGS